MDSNTYSDQPQPSAPTEPGLLEPSVPPGPPGPPGPPEGLGFLPAALGELEAEDLDGLSDTALADETLELQQWTDRLQGQVLRRLAAVDARGAAGADQDQQAPSTAGWLQRRLRMGAGAARSSVRTARALFRGPLPLTARALTSGQLSPGRARVLAQGTRHLPDQVARAAEPVLLEAATRMDPPRLRQAVGYLVEVADPDGADAARQRHHERRGPWLAPTLDDMVAVKGLLEPEADQTVLAALEPLARPADAHDTRFGGQRTADALTELARRAWRAAGCPRPVGSGPSCWSPSTTTASRATPVAWWAILAGSGRWTSRLPAAGL
jgi:hypothetical protein